MCAQRIPESTSSNRQSSFDRDIYHITHTVLNKSTRHIHVRPLPPRLPDILWTEHDDNTLLASPSSLVPGKSKAACTRRLSILRLEAAQRVAARESFLLFPKLPLEIQHMIWSFAAREPRVVELHSVALTAHLEPLPGKAGHAHTLQYQHFRSQTFDPPLLSVCLASHTIALKHYSKHDLSHDMFSDSVYFSFDSDVAFFSARDLNRWFVGASVVFNRSGWMSRARGVFPTSVFQGHAGLRMRKELKTLALDAGFFLGLMGRNENGGDGEGQDVLRPHKGVSRQFMVVVWEQAWQGIKREFKGVEKLVLVLDNQWTGNRDGDLGERSFAAMRLDEVKEGNRQYEVLDELREKMGEWKTMRGENIWTAVDVRLASVKSFRKKGK